LLNIPALTEKITAYARDLMGCLRFFTRLPIPALAFESDIHAMPDFAHAVRMLPLAGALIGGLGGLLLLGLTALRLPVPLVAALVLALLAALTGGLHEDGLADVADGLGGGKDIARKLEIMKDSRLGTYGVLALVFSALARLAALAGLLETYGPGAAFCGLVAASAVSRGACLVPLWLLPAARRDGAAFAAARPSDETMAFVAGLCFAIAMLSIGLGPMGVKRAIFGLIISFVAALGVTELAKAQIKGQTGDVAGAAQQLAEIAFYCALLIAPGV